MGIYCFGHRVSTHHSLDKITPFFLWGNALSLIHPWGRGEYVARMWLIRALSSHSHSGWLRGKYMSTAILLQSGPWE